MLYIIVHIVGDTLTSNNIPLGVISSTDQSSMNLLFKNRLRNKSCCPIGHYIQLACIWLDGQR